MNRWRSAFVLGFLLAASFAWAQTHTVLTTDQSFTTANSRSLTGAYECSANGYVSCPLFSGGRRITSFSGNSSVLATASGAFNAPTDQVMIDSGGNIAPAGEAVRTFGYSSSTGATVATSGTQYMPAVGIGVSTTESNVTEIQPALEVRAIICGTTTAVPGAGTSYTMTVRDGHSGSDCAFACAISETSDNCSGSGACTIASGHAVDIKIVPAGTPTASAISCYLAGVRTG